MPFTTPRIVVPDSKAISALIKDLQKATRLSSAELAKRLGCSRQALSRRRAGKARVPLDWLLKLLTLAGVRAEVRF